MKRILSIILSITMLLSMATIAFADGVDGPMQKAKIKVAISADFKPFEYYDENGELTGFDIDLMNYIGEKIGFDIEFVDMSFDKLIPAVVHEEVACAISAITVTEERDSIIDYSREYLKTYNITFDENGKRSTKYGEQYAIVFREGLSGSPYEDLAEPTMDETVYILIDEALRELSNDRTVTKLIEKYELNKPLDESAINVEYSAIIGGGDPGAETVKKYSFEELTNISAENVVQIAINYNEGERVPATTTESIMIEKIVEDFKDVQFWLDDSAGGGAGGWLYFINFYMKDGTYIQYGTSLHIDKTTYKACDYEESLKTMAYYHDLIQNEDSEPKTSATSIEASEWAWADIDKAKALNIINYGGNYNFPGAITREDFCELIYNYCYNVAKQVGVATGANPFTDTTNSNIIRLQKMGIVYGKSETEFAPNDLLTREEAATILNRLINVVHPDLASTELYFEFADSEQISDWAMSDIQRICNMGIMKGVGNNNFAPQDNYTTEQAIVTLVRVYASSGVSKNVIGGADESTGILIGEQNKEDNDKLIYGYQVDDTGKILNLSELKKFYIEFAMDNRIDFIPDFDEKDYKTNNPVSTEEFLMLTYYMNKDNLSEDLSMSAELVEKVMRENFGIEKVEHKSQFKGWTYVEEENKYTPHPGGTAEDGIFDVINFNSYKENDKKIYDVTLREYYLPFLFSKDDSSLSDIYNSYVEYTKNEENVYRENVLFLLDEKGEKIKNAKINIYNAMYELIVEDNTDGFTAGKTIRIKYYIDEITGTPRFIYKNEELSVLQ